MSSSSTQTVASNVSETKKHVLFLTAETSSAGNETASKDPLVSALRQKGISVSVRSVLEWNRPQRVEEYSYILFLRVWDYNLHLQQFYDFIAQEVEPASKHTHISNPLDIITWNMDKSVYLTELVAAGFLVVGTTYIPLPASQPTILHAMRDQVFSHGAVLKPSISASSFATFLIQDPASPTPTDQTAMQAFATMPPGPAKLMLQPFVPEIRTAGELSLVMVSGHITHAARKIPVSDDFRSQPEFGGAEILLQSNEIDADAVRVAMGVWKYVQEKFAESLSSGRDELLYARIDGVVRADGKFVLMEAEFVEPWLYTDVPQGKRALDMLCDHVSSR